MEFPKLQHPFTMVIAGPTGCGKSYFVRDMIAAKEEMFSIIPDKVVWFYGIHQPLYDEIEDVAFVEGLPTDFKEYLGQHTLFIIDDLMQSSNDKRLSNLFTRGSHHLNLSVIFITQNFFHKGKEMRDITLNAHYLVLSKNRRDLSQVSHLGRQLFPRHVRLFQEVFEDATKDPYTYLFIDLRAETPEELRLRSKILPHQTQCIYQFK
jgi:hypothetical protein